MHKPTAPLVTVCSEIGRGHPAYLDSVLAALSLLPEFRPEMVSRSSCDLFGHGLAGLAWRAARTGYRFGALGGPATWLYNHLRSPHARPSAVQLSLLGSDLRRELAGYAGICLIDHPLLAAILQDTCRVAYLHAEIAAPPSAAVARAWRTFVPLESTASRFEACGVKRTALAVTGLVIEPALLPGAEPAFEARLARLESDAPLCIGFFVSGAYPRPHVNSMLAATVSIARAGHRAILFWGTGWLRAAKVRAALTKLGVSEEQARLVWAGSRRAATARAAELFPQLDLMVAAAHERTNWTVGLGLPMLALLPNIGPFASENYAFAREQDVCLTVRNVDDARELGTAVTELRRTGRLVQMARNGWGVHRVDGARETARLLLAAARH